MKQEDKELLLKDICARLPYKVYAQISDEYGGYTSAIESIDIDGFVKDFEGTQVEIENIKLFLFPLSSISDEIIDEIYNKAGVYDICVDSPVHIEIGTKFEDLSKVFDILHKHHIDYQNLIEKGLAIDATGLNIY